MLKIQLCPDLKAPGWGAIGSWGKKSRHKAASSPRFKSPQEPRALIGALASLTEEYREMVMVFSSQATVLPQP